MRETPLECGLATAKIYTNGKGDKSRVTDRQSFRNNFGKIFGKKKAKR